MYINLYDLQTPFYTQLNGSKYRYVLLIIALNTSYLFTQS